MIFKICKSSSFIKSMRGVHINLGFCLVTNAQILDLVFVLKMMFVKLGWKIVLFSLIHGSWIKTISILHFAAYFSNDVMTFVDFLQLCCIIFKFVFWNWWCIAFSAIIIPWNFWIVETLQLCNFCLLHNAFHCNLHILRSFACIVFPLFYKHDICVDFFHVFDHI